jgi:hypothetical protein
MEKELTMETKPRFSFEVEPSQSLTDETSEMSPMSSTPAADRVRKEIDRLGLHSNVVDLEMSGVTVVPPEKTGIDEEFLNRLRHAMLRVMGERNQIDLLSEDYRTIKVDPKVNLIGNHWHMLYDDDVFAETAVHPVVLALARYLLGESCTMGLAASFVKPGNCAGAAPLSLHYDFPEPMGGGRFAIGANIAVLATDYLEDADGPTVFVPGSHRFGRSPQLWEMDPLKSQYPIMSLRGKAGSIVAWHGATWHGSIPRTKDGVRMHHINMFYRRHIRPAELWSEPEALELCKRIPGMDRVLGLGKFTHAYPAGKDVTQETYKFVTEMGRDIYA